jgi:hypothetical protein
MEGYEPDPYLDQMYTPPFHMSCAAHEAFHIVAWEQPTIESRT